MTPLKKSCDYMLLSVSAIHVGVTQLFLKEFGTTRKIDCKNTTNTVAFEFEKLNLRSNSKQLNNQIVFTAYNHSCETKYWEETGLYPCTVKVQENISRFAEFYT